MGRETVGISGWEQFQGGFGEDFGLVGGWNLLLMADGKMFCNGWCAEVMVSVIVICAKWFKEVRQF
jgi:hypothetical protein